MKAQISKSQLPATLPSFLILLNLIQPFCPAPYLCIKYQENECLLGPPSVWQVFIGYLLCASILLQSSG